jgi:drug/metabolite transporter (DMT)-like permease
MCKSYNVDPEINKEYYSRTRGYTLSILLSLLGALIFSFISGRTDESAPPNWTLIVSAFIVALLLIYKDFNRARTKIFIKPMKSGTVKKKISEFIDIPLRLSIGMTSSAFFNFLQQNANTTSKPLMLFIFLYISFILLLFIFNFTTINIEEKT